MIRKKQPKLETVIDLTGPDGNPATLLAWAKKLCGLLDYDFNQVKAEMMSGNYENVLMVFESYFGNFIILERNMDGDEDDDE